MMPIILIAAAVVYLTQAQMEQGAAEIRSRGYRCDAITLVTQADTDVPVYRVACDRAAYRVQISPIGVWQLEKW